MDVKILNALVSSAIWRAEQLDELMELRDAASLAWLEVSKLEEELAKIKPAKDAEGRIARRGAVRAALKAKDFARAKELAQRFSEGSGAPRKLIKELRDLLKAEGKERAIEQSEVADVRKMISFIDQTFGSFEGSFLTSQVTTSDSEKVKVKGTQDKRANLVNLEVTVHYTAPQVITYNLPASVSKDEHSKQTTSKPHRFNLQELSRN